MEASCCYRVSDSTLNSSEILIFDRFIKIQNLYGALQEYFCPTYKAGIARSGLELIISLGIALKKWIGALQKRSCVLSKAGIARSRLELIIFRGIALQKMIGVLQKLLVKTSSA